MGIDVALPAGGEVRPDRVAGLGTRYKALAQLAGKPLLAWVIEALRATPLVGRIALVASDPVLNELGHLADLADRDRGSGPANLAQAARMLGVDGEILITGCDTPFMTKEAIECFVRACEDDADLYYSYVRSAEFEAAFPGTPYLKIRLRDGDYVGGSLHLARAEAVLELEPILQQAFELRKRPLRLLRLLGVWPILKYVGRRLTVEDIERRASAILGRACRGVLVPYPELAFDVDKPEHLETARAVAARYVH